MKTGNKFLCLVFGLCASWSSEVLSAAPGLTVIQKWSQVEFDYASNDERQSDIDSGVFIPGKPAPIDIDVYYAEQTKHNKIFVTIPRFRSGNPITLGTVSSKLSNGNPIVTPYPSWDWHRNPEDCNTNRLVSVYRTWIDECDRLWVLDNGFYINKQVCPPQILAFDLKTNEVVHKYEIPSGQLEPDALLVTIVVDVRDPKGTCQDTFVYTADCQGFGIIVYDAEKNTSWMVQDKTMYPYPNYGTYTIAGDSFDLMDGILGMAISPYREGYDRVLYYHAMSSPTENWVYTSHLRNQTLFASDPGSSPQLFNTFPRGRNTQSAAEAINKDGIMFFGLMSDIEIDCWNIKTDYDRSNFGVVSNNPETDQFASGIKVIKNRNGEEELWVMTSRFQKIGSGTLNTTEINFRIQAGRVSDLVYGTKCSKRLGLGNRPRY